MKTFLVTLWMICGFAANAAGPKLGSESLMTGPEIKACDPAGRKCLALRAATAEGSQLQPIQHFKKPTVTLSDSKTKKEELIQGTSGYLDLENHQIVIYRRKGRLLTETSFDLNSLQRRDLRIKQ